MLYSRFSLAIYFIHSSVYMDFPGGKVVKSPPANAGDARDVGSIPGSGRSPGEGNVSRRKQPPCLYRTSHICYIAMQCYMQTKLQGGIDGMFNSFIRITDFFMSVCQVTFQESCINRQKERGGGSAFM